VPFKKRTCNDAKLFEIVRKESGNATSEPNAMGGH